MGEIWELGLENTGGYLYTKGRMKPNMEVLKNGEENLGHRRF